VPRTPTGKLLLSRRSLFPRMHPIVCVWYFLSSVPSSIYYAVFSVRPSVQIISTASRYTCCRSTKSVGLSTTEWLKMSASFGIMTHTHTHTQTEREREREREPLRRCRYRGAGAYARRTLKCDERRTALLHTPLKYHIRDPVSVSTF